MSGAKRYSADGMYYTFYRSKLGSEGDKDHAMEEQGSDSA